jgi:hypothetical protein
MNATLAGSFLLPFLFCLLTGVVTYYGAALVQTLFHRIFGHTRRIGKLYRVHVGGHHAQYAPELLSDRWIPTEQHVTWYYAIPFTPMVLIAFWLLPSHLFVVHVLSLGLTVWWHVFLHRQYHVRGVWLERFEWFRVKRRLHFVHHKRPRRNYAIVEYGWDRLFGTFDAGYPTAAPRRGSRCVRTGTSSTARFAWRPPSAILLRRAGPACLNFCSSHMPHRIEIACLVLSALVVAAGCANPINSSTAARYYRAGAAAKRRGDLMFARQCFHRMYVNTQIGLLGAAAEAHSLYEWARVSGYLGKREDVEWAFPRVLELIAKAKGKADELRGPAGSSVV